MKATECRFTWRGEEFRVVVADDVVSIVGYARSPGWSMGGFGPYIAAEWLLEKGGLPGSKARKDALISMIHSALRAHHGDAVTEGEGLVRPFGPFIPCPTCTRQGSPIHGFVPAPQKGGEPLVPNVDERATGG